MSLLNVLMVHPEEVRGGKHSGIKPVHLEAGRAWPF